MAHDGGQILFVMHACKSETNLFAFYAVCAAIYIYIPRALRATPPPCLTKSKTEKQTKTVLFLDAPGVPQTSLLGAPGLHFVTLGIILATRAPKGRQSRPKGPQSKNSLFRNRQLEDFGTPLETTLAPLGLLFRVFVCKSGRLNSCRVFFTIFFRKATSTQRLHVAKP